MHGWQVNKKYICATPVVKGYARKCKATRYAGRYLLYIIYNT